MRGLYSRTQFWFGLKAGGSVGHTVGVLNGFSQLAQVEVLSNERIYAIDALPCQIVKPLGRGGIGELLYNFYYAPALAAKLKKFKPDFVYHRYNGFSFATTSVCRRLEVPLVLEFNSSDLWKLQHWSGSRRGFKARVTKPIKRLIFKCIEPFNLQSALLIVVVSTPLKESLVSRGLPANRILVNPNAVDPGKFKPAAPEVYLPIKQNLGIPPDKIVVGFSGTFGQWHGIPELTEAILRLNADPTWREQLHFVLYGDGGMRTMVKRRIGHFNNVLFTGTVEYEYIQDYLSICDILLSPHGKTPDGCEFFGSPTKLFEYMAVGKGIVASELGQIGEVLEHKKTAWLVQPGDIEGLVEGILRLAQDANLRKQLGQNARKEVLAKYTWKIHVQRILNKLQELGIG